MASVWSRVACRGREPDDFGIGEVAACLLRDLLWQVPGSACGVLRDPAIADGDVEGANGVTGSRPVVGSQIVDPWRATGV